MGVEFSVHRIDVDSIEAETHPLGESSHVLHLSFKDENKAWHEVTLFSASPFPDKLEILRN